MSDDNQTRISGNRVTKPEQLYRWSWRVKLPDRHGQLFRVLCRGTMNSCSIEFLSDGWRCVTSHNGLRKA